MRVGRSKAKDDNVLAQEAYHRVIIPVYIPNLEEDYFKDGLEILKYCLGTLLRTIHDKTRVSIINNGCETTVTTYLDTLYREHEQIDQLLHSKINLGKINAIYAALKSNLEPIITITDADVMFLNHWQSEVERTFQQFPKAGMVSPVPSSTAYTNVLGSATFGHAVVGGKLRFRESVNPDGMIKFQESVGRTMYTEAHLAQYPCIKEKEHFAVIGCGHFVVSMKRKSFDAAPVRPSNHKIVGGSERKYIDKPNNDMGLYRLSTLDNYAFHLGNVKEEWMEAYDKGVTERAQAVAPGSLHLEQRGVGSFYKKAGAVLLKIFKKSSRLKISYFRSRGLKSKHY